MRILLVCLALLAALGCGGAAALQQSVQGGRDPEWVNAGTGAYTGDRGRLFVGVGIASGIRDANKRRATVDGRARAEVAKILQAFAVSEVAQVSASSEADVRSAVEEALQRSLLEVSLVDHWVDRDGTEFAMAQLGLDSFKNAISRSTLLDDKSKEVARAVAERSFDQFSTVGAAPSARVADLTSVPEQVPGPAQAEEPAASGPTASGQVAQGGGDQSARAEAARAQATAAVERAAQAERERAARAKLAQEEDAKAAHDKSDRERTAGQARLRSGRLAVLEFRSKLKAADKEALDAGYFANVVRATVKRSIPTLFVITRENLITLVKAAGKTLEQCEGECEVETGRLISADLVISGDLLKIGSRYKLDLRLHETAGGNLLNGVQASGKDADELDSAIAAKIAELLAPLKA